MRKSEIKVGTEVEHQPSGRYLGRVTRYGGGVTLFVRIEGEEERLATIHEVRKLKKNG